VIKNFNCTAALLFTKYKGTILLNVKHSKINDWVYYEITHKTIKHHKKAFMPTIMVHAIFR